MSSTTLPEGLTPREIDDAVARGGGRGRGPLPPRRRRPRRPRRRPRRHPGPLRGLRRRRHRRRRRAGPPRLHAPTCSPSTRTPSTRCSTPSWRSVARPATRAPRSPWSRRCASGWMPCARGCAGRPRPRVVVLEWTDPPYAPGHWIPEMVDGRRRRAGARRGRREVGAGDLGRRARRRAGRRRVRAVRLRPGRGAAAGRRRSWRPGCSRPACAVHAVDANGQWARPGPRLVDGVEELAALLHP